MNKHLAARFSGMLGITLILLCLLPPSLHAAPLGEARVAQGVSGINTIRGGIFLVADPKIKDPNFAKTVVLILHHDEGGSSGLVINRPTEQTLPELLPNIESVAAGERLFEGGPVLREETLTLLFRSEIPPKKAMVPVFETVYVTQEARIFASILREETQAEAYRLFMGYSGWGSEQLQNEITRGDWHLVAGDADALFEADMTRIWDRMFARSQRRFVNALKRVEAQKIGRRNECLGICCEIPGRFEIHDNGLSAGSRVNGTQGKRTRLIAHPPHQVSRLISALNTHKIKPRRAALEMPLP